MMRKTTSFRSIATGLYMGLAVGVLTTMTMGEANAAACPAANFSWATSQGFVNGECQDQDKTWGFDNTTLPDDWANGAVDVPPESQIDVDFAVFLTGDVHSVEYKELEHFVSGELDGGVIDGHIFVDDPAFFIDLVSLDTAGFFATAGQTVVTKELFSDAALTNSLLTLTSTNGSSDSGFLGGLYNSPLTKSVLDELGEV